MAYTINKTNGELFAIVEDGAINQNSSITLLGRNYAGYGQFLNENYLRLLENHANDTAPGSPVTGQLWFDTLSGSLQIYNGSAFKSLGRLSTQGTAPIGNTIGDLWFDISNSQLNVYDGADFIVVGPSATVGNTTTGAVPTIIKDVGLVDHYIVKLFAEDRVVGIISRDAEFTPRPEDTILGFTTISPGITLADVIGGQTPIFKGTASNADKLDNLDSLQFLRSDIDDYTTGNLGIGITSPVYSLDVGKDQNSTTFVSVTNNGTGGNATAGFRAKTDVGHGWFRTLATGVNYGFGPTAGDTTIDQVATNKNLWLVNTTGEIGFVSGNTIERMRLDVSGHLGIGTSTPLSILQLGPASYSATVSPTNYITFGKRTNSTESALPIIGHDSIDGVESGLGINTASTSGGINFYTGNQTGFVNSHLRMRLDKDGQLCLGDVNTHPMEAWDNLYVVMRLGKSGSIFGDRDYVSNSHIRIGEGYYYGGSQRKGIYTEPNGAVSLAFQGGAAFFEVSNGGVTANTSFTWTEALKIYNNGGVTIGSPAGSNKGPGTLNVQTGIYVNNSIVALAANFLPITGGTVTGSVTATGTLTANVASVVTTSGSPYLRLTSTALGGTYNFGQISLSSSTGDLTIHDDHALSDIVFTVNNGTYQNLERLRIRGGAGYSYFGDIFGEVIVTASSTICIAANRTGSDGTVISIRQNGTEEGTISVSGTTVSYNAFAGSHWSQLADNTNPVIEIGTVLSTIDELCTWDGVDDVRLARFKISDIVGDTSVYGVFNSWDEDGDAIVTSLGAYNVRVTGPCNNGDLLESNGDGTAKVQSDGIIRNSTIGKVTVGNSMAAANEINLIPCVLYCG